MKKLSRVSTKVLEAQLVACADMRAFYEKDVGNRKQKCEFCNAASTHDRPYCNNCPWTWFRRNKKDELRLCIYYIWKELDLSTSAIKFYDDPKISLARSARVKEITVWMELISEELALRA